ncbi:Serine protease family S01A [Phytophthora palmivora]|uniref:Serine protease family S01A n=1 Tax=Phytophthora palmivora TaxID=4796 RepID=A0A2P4X068_9STRA|nr:Serine protease family S01A [Phytophthora palmivora]
MLDNPAEFDGNEVLVIQDQNDVRCSVVIQTAVQNLAFKHWGESICMDWTYGSLLVTSSTGRGVPVLNFIALNETMETMEAILEFFKSNNKF